MNLTGAGMLINEDCISFLNIKYATIEGRKVEISGEITTALERLQYGKKVDRVISNPGIEKVIFNPPATVVNWEDGSKTVAKCRPGDTYDAEIGLVVCIAKKCLGSQRNFNEVFKKWIPEEMKINRDTMFTRLGEYCDRVGDCKNCLLDKVCIEDGGCYTAVSYDILRKHYKMVFGK